MAVVTDDTEASGYIFTMAITGIKMRKTEGIDNVLCQTYWKLTGELQECPDCGETHTAEFNGATPLPNPKVDTNGDGFINWDDLTEEMVIDWVSNILKNDLHPFERIAKQIDNLHIDEVSATSESDFPWASA